MANKKLTYNPRIHIRHDHVLQAGMSGPARVTCSFLSLQSENMFTGILFKYLGNGYLVFTEHGFRESEGGPAHYDFDNYLVVTPYRFQLSRPEGRSNGISLSDLVDTDTFRSKQDKGIDVACMKVRPGYVKLLKDHFVTEYLPFPNYDSTLREEFTYMLAGFPYDSMEKSEENKKIYTGGSFYVLPAHEEMNQEEGVIVLDYIAPKAYNIDGDTPVINPPRPPGISGAGIWQINAQRSKASEIIKYTSQLVGIEYGTRGPRTHAGLRVEKILGTPFSHVLDLINESL